MAESDRLADVLSSVLEGLGACRRSMEACRQSNEDIREKLRDLDDKLEDNGHQLGHFVTGMHECHSEVRALREVVEKHLTGLLPRDAPAQAAPKATPKAPPRPWVAQELHTVSAVLVVEEPQATQAVQVAEVPQAPAVLDAEAPQAAAVVNGCNEVVEVCGVVRQAMTGLSREMCDLDVHVCQIVECLHDIPKMVAKALQKYTEERDSEFHLQCRNAAHVAVDDHIRRGTSIYDLTVQQVERTAYEAFNRRVLGEGGLLEQVLAAAAAQAPALALPPVPPAEHPALADGERGLPALADSPGGRAGSSGCFGCN